jgi:hypothetical protein
MSLENWRSLNYFFQDLIVLQMFFVTGLVSFRMNTTSKKYRPIIIYLIFSVVLEIISKFFLKINPESLYFTYNNFVFIIFEAWFVYWYLFMTFPAQKILKTWLIINFSFILLFFGYLVYSKNPNSDYRSFVPAFLHILILLYALYLIVKTKTSNSLLKNPDFIILLSFLMSYTILILVFFFLPPIIEYSRLLANQFIFVKYLIAMFFYTFIAYALSIKRSYHL